MPYVQAAITGILAGSPAYLQIRDALIYEAGEIADRAMENRK